MKKMLFITIILIAIFTAGVVSAAPCSLKGAEVCLDNPINTTDIPTIFGQLVKVATSIMGSLALLVFVFGGFMWITAAGSPEKVKKGTTAMLWAVIGIIVIFSSYAIIKLVLDGMGVTEYVAPPVTNYDKENSSGSETGCYCNYIDGEKKDNPVVVPEYNANECNNRRNEPAQASGVNNSGGAGCAWHEAAPKN